MAMRDNLNNPLKLAIRGIKNPEKIPSFLERVLVVKCLSPYTIEYLNREDLKSRAEFLYSEFDAPETHVISSPETIKDRVVLDRAINEWLNFPPRNRQIIERNERMYTYRMKSHAPFVAELRDARFFGPYGLVLTPQQELPLEIKASHLYQVNKLFYQTLKDWGRVQTLREYWFDNSVSTESGPMVSMLNLRPIPQRMAYGHWLLEVLPKMRGVEHYHSETGHTPTVLVDPHIAEWQKQLLHLVGVEEDRIRIWHGGSMKVDRLVLPRWGKNEYCRSDLRWVGDRIKRNVDYEAYLDDFPERVYLSREDLPRRKVSNRKEITDMLLDYDFRVLKTEQLSFPEQVALFENAEVLVGPNGSAFANTIFSDHTNVVQLFPGNYFQYRFYEINQILGHECFPLLGLEINSPPNHNVNFEVSARKLEDLVSKIL